jgi:hypothetical protein
VIPIGGELSKYREWVKGLKKYHDRHFLVWNFTDPGKRRFETKDFDDQVIDSIQQERDDSRVSLADLSRLQSRFWTS